MPALTSRRLPTAPVVLGVLSIAGYIALLTWGMEHTSFDVWGSLLVGPALLLLSWPLIGAASRAAGDPWVGRLLWFALVAKLASSIARWFVAFVVYGGTADASRYNRLGADLAALYRDGIFTVQTERDFIGTGFIVVLTGVIYTLTGPTLIGGFLVYSWLGFWGIVFCYMAFRRAVPQGDHRRYALLVFFLPSMLFWPSSIGKESWMMLCIGLTLYGTAWLFTHARGAYPLITLGLVASAVVRPHVTLMLFVGIFIGYLLRRSRRRTALTPVVKGGALAALVAAGLLIFSQAATFLGIEDRSVDGIFEAIEGTGELTDEGGSTFTPNPVRSPLDLPIAAVTVLFRPFPFEAHNPQALLVSAEGVLLMALLVVSWQRLAALPRVARSNPYVMSTLPFLLLFVIGFSSFGNFGILARERVMVLPFVLVLVCLPTVARVRSKRPRPLRHHANPERILTP